MEGKEIIHKQAPCFPDGEINTAEGENESKEGLCRCAANPSGCFVDGIGRILPLQLRDDVPLPSA